MVVVAMKVIRFWGAQGTSPVPIFLTHRVALPFYEHGNYQGACHVQIANVKCYPQTQALRQRRQRSDPDGYFALCVGQELAQGIAYLPGPPSLGSHE